MAHDVNRADDLAALEADALSLRGEMGRLRNTPDLLLGHVRNRYPDLMPMLFSGRDLRRTDFAKMDLRGIDFRGSDLEGCDFRDARIAGARFELAHVERAALRESVDWDSHVRHWSPEPPRRAFHRMPGEPFSLAPWLPQVEILPPDMADGLLGEPDADAAELEALASGRLALSRDCLSGAEWNAVREQPARATDGDTKHWRLVEAKGYLDAFMEPGEDAAPRVALAMIDASVRIPSRALLWQAARDQRVRTGAGGIEYAVTGGHPVATHTDDGRPATGARVAGLRPVFIMGRDHDRP